MDYKDIFTVAIWGSITAFMIFLGLRNSIVSKSLEEERKREHDSKVKEAAEVESQDLKHISLATELLPDGYAAMARLNERFLWYEILSAMSYHKMQTRLLQEIFASQTIELPSLHASRPNHADASAIAAAKRIAKKSSLGDEFRFGDIVSGQPIEVFQQEPTVSTLMELVSSELVVATPPPSHECRIYQATLTSTGDRLASFDRHFDTSEQRRVVRLPLPKSDAARHAIAVFGHRALVESPPSASRTAFTELQQGTFIYHLLHDSESGSTRLINLRILLLMPVEFDADELWQQAYPIEKRITYSEAVAAIAEARRLIPNPNGTPFTKVSH